MVIIALILQSLSYNPDLIDNYINYKGILKHEQKSATALEMRIHDSFNRYGFLLERDAKWKLLASDCNAINETMEFFDVLKFYCDLYLEPKWQNIEGSVNRISEKNDSSKLLKALLYEKLGHYTKAYEIVEKIGLEKFPLISKRLQLRIPEHRESVVESLKSKYEIVPEYAALIGNYFFDIGEYAESAKYHLVASKHGVVEAKYNLGILFYYGKGVEKNYDVALELLQSSFSDSYYKAVFPIGRIYFHKGEYSLAKKYLKKAQGMRMRGAAYYLGMAYMKSVETHSDFEVGERYLIQAGEEGMSEAYDFLFESLIVMAEVQGDVAYLNKAVRLLCSKKLSDNFDASIRLEGKQCSCEKSNDI